MYSLGSQLITSKQQQPQIGLSDSWASVITDFVQTAGSTVTAIVNKPKTITPVSLQSDANAYAANTNANTASILPSASNLPFGLTPTTLIAGGVGILLLVKLMKKSGK